MIDAIPAIVTAAITRGIFPGAVVLAARAGEPVHVAAYGTTMYADPGSCPVTCETIYDIASLTKAVTATAALILADRGLLDLYAPAQDYLPGLAARDLTAWHLLTHTSGLAVRLSALCTLDPAALISTVLATQPLQPPGTRVAYTNVNSLLLGMIVARVAGMALDAAVHALVLAPLGMQQTCFRPASADRGRIAPTEYDHSWRGMLVHGTVHDESAAALGGVAGHAGLFSTAADLWRFSRMWLLNGYDPGSGRQLIDPGTVALATRNHTVGLEAGCGLGWMIDRENFMGGWRHGVFGHTGFTGPALVLRPADGTALVVLSNRVYPRRMPPVHHAVTAELWACVAGSADSVSKA